MPVLPIDEPVRTVPDRVCEILSPSTRRHDWLVKLPYYAKIDVRHHWLVDLDARVLIVNRLETSDWHIIATHSDERDARMEPFEAVPLDVAEWWPP